jgi:hypothetical protein
VDPVRRFVAGVAAGVVLALPLEMGRTAPAVPEPPPQLAYPQLLWVPAADLDVVYGDIEGQEQCLIDWMEAEVGAGWDVVTVITFLDRAWAEFDGPCDAWEELR